MQINPIDIQKDLFQINHILDEGLIQRLSREALESLPFRKQEMQTTWNRRLIVVLPGSVFENIAEYYNSKKIEIGNQIGLNIINIDTRFWLDYEGFQMGRHLDNDRVKNVMQIFLSNGPAELGTTFYDNNNVRKAFKFTKNSGYIMFNNSQQMHGMENKVPRNIQRLTSYSYLQTQ